MPAPLPSDELFVASDQSDDPDLDTYVFDEVEITIKTTRYVGEVDGDGPGQLPLAAIRLYSYTNTCSSNYDHILTNVNDCLPCRRYKGLTNIDPAI